MNRSAESASMPLPKRKKAPAEMRFTHKGPRSPRMKARARARRLPGFRMILCCHWPIQSISLGPKVSGTSISVMCCTYEEEK